METKIDPSQFKYVLADALQDANWLPRIGVEKDTDGKVTIPLLSPLTTLQPADFIKEIRVTKLAMSKQYNSMLEVVCKGHRQTFKFHELLWGRMCVIAYYFYHDDPFWQTVGLKEMKAQIEDTAIISDVDIAMRSIDQLFEKMARVKQTNYAPTRAQPTAPSLPNEQSSQPDTQLQLEYEELKAQLAQKDEHIKRLQARIDELEDTNFFRFSFIRSYDKPINKIKWAMLDINEAKDSATKTAACLKNLQRNDMLNDQERFGPLKDVKAMCDEMKKHLKFKWGYPALMKALKHPPKQNT